MSTQPDVFGADESSALLEPTGLGEVDGGLYGEAKVGFEQAARQASGHRPLIARAGRAER
jgi:2'-hydroxyisoflavone reductase